MIENPSIKHKQLVTDFQVGKISLAELQKECAYWYLDCFDEIHPKPEPTAPIELLEFRNMSYKEKNEMIKSGFFLTPIIKNYLDGKDLVINENKACIYWLKEHLSHIPAEDVVARSRFAEKISEFEERDFA